MTTLLSIAQSAIEDIGGFDVPTSVINNDDETATLLKSTMNRVGRMLANNHDFEALKVEHTFSTVASTSEYSWPDGFRKLIIRSFWDRTNDRRVIGPVSSGRWQWFQSSGVGPAGIDRYFRKRAGVFDIYPTPDSADSLVFEYYSKYWCSDDAAAGQSSWLANTDLALLDDELLLLAVKYRFLMSKGEPYQEEYEEFADYRDSLLVNDEGEQSLTMDMDVNQIRDHHGQIPDTGFGA